MADEFSLPFSDAKQQAVVGFMLTNEKFYKTTCAKIEPEWFLSAKCGELVRILKKYYNEYKFFPTLPSFHSYREFLAMDLKKSNELRNLATVCVSSANNFRQEEVKKDLSEWFQATTLMTAMNKASKSYLNKDIPSTYRVLNEAVQEVNHGYFNESAEMDFENFEVYLDEFEKQRDGALTTGLSILDRAILKDAKGGCLLPGDSTIVLSAVNNGKTTWLITVACHNILRGKDVLFVTHEGNPEYIRLMFLANILGCSVNDIFFVRNTPEGKDRLKAAATLMKKHLTYIPYNKAGGMVVEEVVPVINQAQDARKAEKGKGYDLLVDDYPQVLSSQLAYKGTLQKRNIDTIIYGNFIQLALEHKFHFLGAIQTNREGSKVNKQMGGSTRILVSEDVQESFGVIQSANTVITINRSPYAEKNNIATFGISKSRTNKKGLAVICKTNFSHCKTHSNELGGMLYEGAHCIDTQFEKFFARYKNEEILDDIRNAFGG